MTIKIERTTMIMISDLESVSSGYGYGGVGPGGGIGGSGSGGFGVGGIGISPILWEVSIPFGDGL